MNKKIETICKMISLRIFIIFFIVAFIVFIKSVISLRAQNLRYENNLEDTSENSNQWNRYKRGLVSFPSWDPSTSTALATAIANLMCTAPELEEKKGCKINIKSLNDEHSLILDPANASYFLYPDTDGNIKFKHGDPVLLSCSNTGGITFRNLDEPVSKVFNCVCNETFRADNTLYNFKDLGCTATPRHHVRDAGEAGTYKRYQIGFQTTVENDFLNLVDVYYDLAYNRTAYVVSKISKYIRGGQRITEKNVSFGMNYQTYADIDSFYNFESQVSSFALQFDIPEGKTVPYLSPNESDELKLTRSQLTPKLSMIYTAGAKASFEHLNVVPQWQLIGSHNWARIEQHVMDMASELNRDLVIVTGTFDQLLLRDSYDNVNEMYLNAVVDNYELQLRLPIPKFTFKVVMDTVRMPVAGVVYVTVNDPFMRVEEEDRYRICRKPFTNRDNMKTPERWMPEDPKQGFSYLCEVDDFLSTTRIVLPYINVGDVQEFLFLPSQIDIKSKNLLFYYNFDHFHNKILRIFLLF